MRTLSWMAATFLCLTIVFSVFWGFIKPKREGFDPALECRDPDTNLKITDAEITKDAKHLIIHQGTGVKKLYTQNGMELTSPKVVDHILVEVMDVRKRPIYQQYPACAKQLAKSLKHEMGSSIQE
jgi:hypothetical protein